jgi:DivIVA domain-containing protein
MFEPKPGSQPLGSTSAADAGSAPAERVMRIAPLDLRQPRFKKALNGFDRTEVVAFLTEAADDYEHALAGDRSAPAGPRRAPRRS